MSEAPHSSHYWRNVGDPLPSDRIDHLVLSPRELSRYSLLRATDAARHGDYSKAGFEREVALELRRRAGQPEPDLHTLPVPAQILARDLTMASATGGGYLAGDTPVYGVIDALRDTSVIFRAGAQGLTGLRHNGTYARQGTKSTITWQVTEATEATETASLSLGSVVSGGIEPLLFGGEEADWRMPRARASRPA